MKNLIENKRGKLIEAKLKDGSFSDEYEAGDALLGIIMDGWSDGASMALKKAGLNSSEIKEIEKDLGYAMERFLDRSAEGLVKDLAGTRAAMRLTK